MPLRLVIPQDLIDYPELNSQGISVNMNYDFPETPPSESISEAAKDESQEIIKPTPKKKATKVTHKATPIKQKAKRK